MSAPGEIGRVVVTGASGFIGRRLFRALDNAGAEVVAWSRQDVDLLDVAAVAQALDRNRPDCIFHLASSGVSAVRAHDAAVIREDIVMTEALIRSAREGTRIVLAGSMSEYGASGRLAETDRCSPATAYGIAKLASGLYAAAYGEKAGLHISIARLFGVYGPGEAPQRLFPHLVAAMRERRRIALSDGLQRRDFIHVDDACDVLMALAARSAPSSVTVNVGTGQAVRVRDVAEWIADAAGAPRDLLGFGERDRSPGDEALLEADTRLLGTMVGPLPPQRLVPGLSLDLFDAGAAH